VPRRNDDRVPVSATAPTPRRQGVELALRGLAKRFGTTQALRGIDLVVPGGEFLTILGPSGSGKSTLLRLVAGFTDPSEGQILIGGHDVSQMPPAERSIGIVPQGYALFPHLTAAENVGYGLKMRGWPKTERSAQIATMLELVGLSGLGGRRPKELSGGQQQRVALARALAFGPDVLLMDEPLGALDRELRVRMAGELRRVHAELGTTIVYVTHDREEALTLSDRIAVMHDGALDAVDKPDNLYDRPRSRFVARFFGAHNMLPVKVLSVDPPDSGTGAYMLTVDLLSRVVHASSWCDIAAGEQAEMALPARAVSFPAEPDALAVHVHINDLLYFGETVQAMCSIVGGADQQLRAEVPASEGRTLTHGAEVAARLDLSRAVIVK
jgi:ABC-type Fe3+/spermidine/putrescine transport system ATPase subunit